MFKGKQAALSSIIGYIDYGKTALNPTDFLKQPEAFEEFSDELIVLFREAALVLGFSETAARQSASICELKIGEIQIALLAADNCAAGRLLIAARFHLPSKLLDARALRALLELGTGLMVRGEIAVGLDTECGVILMHRMVLEREDPQELAEAFKNMASIAITVRVQLIEHHTADTESTKH